MSLWFVFALMTAVAVFAVLWPLGRGRIRAAEGLESEIYKDQLRELQRDVASGLIAQTEADTARIEISRRLLAAVDAEAKVHDHGAAPSPRARRMSAVIALVALPLGALALYTHLGSPTIADLPLAARQTAPVNKDSIVDLVAKVEAHLERNPQDGKGWEVLAPVLLRLGRFDDAVRARRNALAFLEPNAVRHADLGEALVAAANGVVTAEAKSEFEKAHTLDAQDAKANYFLGLAAQQDGRKDEATAIWRKMLEGAPANAPWAPLVRGALARLDPAAAASTEGSAATRGPSAEDVDAAGKMSEGDRAGMIRSMVDRLATRLKTDGQDAEGWLRLVRAYGVMGEVAKQKSAITDARAALKDRTELLGTFNDGLKAMGIEN